jgi:hypothetical protein
MTKPVTSQEMFDMWQKMVNPGAYPLQSLMFPMLDAKEIEKKIAELEAVEHWLKANVNMIQLTIKSLQYQRAMLKGGEKFQEEMKGGRGGEQASPATWAWNMMANAGKDLGAETSKPRAPVPSKKKKKKKKKSLSRISAGRGPSRR